jgi:predicted Zn-dependent peptidase
LGTRYTVSALSTTDRRARPGRAYVPRNGVISAAGKVDPEPLRAPRGGLGWFAGPDRAGDPPTTPPVTPGMRGGEQRHVKDGAQTHIVFATDTVPFSDRRKFALLVLANIFGGGMSSRLFQRVREELGLAYTVYAYTSFYRAQGVLGVYVGTQPGTAEQAAAAIREEYAAMARDGLRGEALTDAKRQTQGQLMLSLESPSARMYRLAGGEVYGEPYRSLDDVLAEVARLEDDAVVDVAAEFFAPERQTVTWLGPAAPG